MKPGLKTWASDGTWNNGANEGTDNKAEFAAGEAEGGFAENETVAADLWNMWRWRVSELMKNAAAVRFMNIFEGDKSGLQTITDSSYDFTENVWGGYSPKYKTHTLVSVNAGSNDIRDFLADGHQMWRTDATHETIDYGASPSGTQVRYIPSPGRSRHSDVGGTFSAATEVKGFHCDQGTSTDTRVITLNDGSGVYFSQDFGYWTFWSGSTDEGNNWGDVESDRQGKWVFYNYFDQKLFYSDSVGGTLEEATISTTPSVTNAGCIRHSHHQAGHLQHTDPGNPVWLFLGPTATTYRLFRSIDGESWDLLSTVDSEGDAYDLTPLRDQAMSYSAYGGRWCVLNDTSDYDTDVPTIVFSEDNGTTWQEVDDAFGLAAESLDKTDCGDANIETDGWGHWMVSIQVDNGTDEETRFYVSVDNGDTWKRVFASVSNPTYEPNTGEISDDVGTALWYGQGRMNFFLIGQVAGAGNAVQQPMATLEVID